MLFHINSFINLVNTRIYIPQRQSCTAVLLVSLDLLSYGLQDELLNNETRKNEKLKKGRKIADTRVK